MLSKTQLIEKLVASSDGLSKKNVKGLVEDLPNRPQGAQEVRGVRRPWPREVRRGQEAGDQGEEGHQSLHEGADGVQGQAGAQGAQNPGGQGRQGRAPLVLPAQAAFRCTQVGSSHLRAASRRGRTRLPLDAVAQRDDATGCLKSPGAGRRPGRALRRTRCRRRGDREHREPDLVGESKAQARRRNLAPPTQQMFRCSASGGCPASGRGHPNRTRRRSSSAASGA